MFHASSTLHHHRSSFSGHSGESRLVYAWTDAPKRWMLGGRVAWDYLSPVRKVTNVFFRPVTLPLEIAGRASMEALRSVIHGAEWTYFAGLEVGKGALGMTAKPLERLTKSRSIGRLKELMWNLPLATLSAAWRLPIAFATSPYEMAMGVREGANSVLGNIKGILKSLRDFRLGETIKNTRDLVWDTISPIVKRPLAPILAPLAAMAMTVYQGEVGNTATAFRESYNDILAGANTVKSAPNTASSIMAQRDQAAAMRKALLEEKKKEEEQAIADEVAKAQGKTPASEKKGGPGGAKKAA